MPKGYSDCLNLLIFGKTMPGQHTRTSCGRPSSLYFLLSSYRNSRTTDFSFCVDLRPFLLYHWRNCGPEKLWLLKELSGRTETYLTPRPELFLLNQAVFRSQGLVLNQGLTNFFCKESDSKYFRLCGIKRQNFNKSNLKISWPFISNAWSQSAPHLQKIERCLFGHGRTIGFYKIAWVGTRKQHNTKADWLTSGYL